MVRFCLCGKREFSLDSFSSHENLQEEINDSVEQKASLEQIIKQKQQELDNLRDNPIVDQDPTAVLAWQGQIHLIQTELEGLFGERDERNSASGEDLDPELNVRFVRNDASCEELLSMWFGEHECRLSQRELKRMSLLDVRNKMGFDANQRIRVEGTFKEIPDESLICDLFEEGRTRLHSSPRTNSNSMCTICQDPLTENDVVVTNHECGHQLHSKCASQLFGFSTRCPCCRAHFKTFDEYCPQKGVIEKHHSFERELRVDGSFEFDPEDVLGPSDMSESPVAMPARRPSTRRSLPRSYAESVIIDIDRRDPARSNRASLRSLGRTFRFTNSMLEVVDGSEEENQPEEWGGDELDIDEQSINCLNCDQTITNAELSLTCRICQRQECHECGRDSISQCPFCENHFHFHCEILIHTGACSSCTQAAHE